MRRAPPALLLLALLPPAAAAPTGAARVRVPGVGLLRVNTLPSGTTEALGIPYAAPPVGERRFAPPAPAAPPRGGGAEIDATAYGPVCMQVAVGYEDGVAEKVARHMSEDCLTLNVWAPPGAAALPVYFWIHGGAFIQGSGSWFNGSTLAARGIVVVTINYRLGVFGFLNVDRFARGGNASSGGVNGLLDQAEALRWVRAHIRAFGGDPGRVSIGGESAGSLSVCDHLHMPASQGLFHRAVMESGSCVGGGRPELMVMPRADARALAAALLLALGEPRSLAALRAKNGTTMLLATVPLLPVGLFYPSVDGVYLTRSPDELPVASRGVDIIGGTNTAEGDATMPTDLLTPLGLTTPEYYTQYVSDQLTPDALSFYPAPPANSKPELVRKAYLTLQTDIMWTCPKFTLAAKLRDAGNKVRSYSFGFWPNASAGGALLDMVCHGCEESFMWGYTPVDDGYASPYIGEFTKEVFDAGLAKTMSAYWASFVLTGTPQGSTEWATYDGGYGPELHVRSKDGAPVLTSASGPQKACDFWAKFMASSKDNYNKVVNFTMPNGGSSGDGSEGAAGRARRVLHRARRARRAAGA